MAIFLHRAYQRLLNQSKPNVAQLITSSSSCYVEISCEKLLIFLALLISCACRCTLLKPGVGHQAYRTSEDALQPKWLPFEGSRRNVSRNGEQSHKKPRLGHLIGISQLKRFPIYLFMKAMDQNTHYIKIHILASKLKIFRDEGLLKGQSWKVSIKG